MAFYVIESITPRTWREELKLLREENESKKNDEERQESEIKISEEKLNEFHILPEDKQNIGNHDVLVNEASNTTTFLIEENINEECESAGVNGNLFNVLPENKNMPLTTTSCEIKILQKNNGTSSKLSAKRVAPLSKKAKKKFIQGIDINFPYSSNFIGTIFLQSLTVIKSRIIFLPPFYFKSCICDKLC